MKADRRFKKKPKYFWACVRTISQKIGYSSSNEIIKPSIAQIEKCFAELNLNTEAVCLNGNTTQLGRELLSYFEYRQAVLNNYVQHKLMDAAQAREVFMATKAQLCPKRPVPMNKQKGDKKAEAYLTGLVNMIVESEIGDLDCDYDPHILTTFTEKGLPVRTLARRVDGAFPSAVNPVAIWEIKEYYYTTTFGSRVADGVYVTLLDGMEIEELSDSEGIECNHILMIDARYTWWTCGKSYLCRIIDMLHMGYCDEVLFGMEVCERLPELVREWIKVKKTSNRQKHEPSI